MSTINDKTGLCLQVEENLADVLDGAGIDLVVSSAARERSAAARVER